MEQLELFGAVGCEECNDLVDNCPHCCPHGDLDHGVCQDCEKDLSEDIAANAYDYLKDRD